MSRYARRTRVDKGASISEIERTISRYGADAFRYGHEGDRPDDAQGQRGAERDVRTGRRDSRGHVRPWQDG